jgi:plasmid stability protein
MPGLVIKNLPPELHSRLKERAARHHRSMTREVIAVLEEVLQSRAVAGPLPPPYRGRIALSDVLLQQARREGRK